MLKTRRWHPSIKIQFFIVICTIAVTFVGILTFLNLFFYDRYYTYERKQALLEIYQQVYTSYENDQVKLDDSLENIENHTGVRISIVNLEKGMIYNSIFRGPVNAGKEENHEIIFYDMLEAGAVLSEIDREALLEKGYLYITIDGIDGIDGIAGRAPQTPENFAPVNQFLCLVGLLNQDTIILERIPVSYIKQNSSFNSTFLFVTSLFTLPICIVFAYWLSRRFTRPLIEIEEVATAMAKLDFSKQYTRTSEDEIGQLGKSINQLSAHLKAAIDQLKCANAELAFEIKEKERIDSMRREFIVNVSHELKTPLAVIQGYAEGLRVGVTDNEEDREYYCDIIVDEAQRMNRMVMQLLSLSKLELGRQPPELTDVDLYALCSQLVEKTRVLAQNRQICFDGVQAVVYADAQMMEQVVSNYLSNAIRYTPDGGKIRMYTTQELPDKVIFSIENEGDNIAPEALPFLFDQFYRTDKARSRESGGTGVGLSIVRAIIDLHGGSCGVENIPEGVRFWFTVSALPQV